MYCVPAKMHDSAYPWKNRIAIRSWGFWAAAFAIVSIAHSVIMNGKKFPGRNLVSKMLLGIIPLDGGLV